MAGDDRECVMWGGAQRGGAAFGGILWSGAQLPMTSKVAPNNDIKMSLFLKRRTGFSHLSRILNRSPWVFHPFLFCSQKRNGWSPKKKPPPISLCLIPVPVGGWPETRCAQTVGPEFPPPLTSIAPAGPARLRMGGEAEWDFNVPTQVRGLRC